MRGAIFEKFQNKVSQDPHAHFDVDVRCDTNCSTLCILPSKYI